MLFSQLTPKQRLAIFGVLSATAAALLAVVLLNRSTSELVNLNPEPFVAALPTPPAPAVSKDIQGDFASGADNASESEQPATLHHRKNEATLTESFALDATPKFAASFQQSGSGGGSDSSNASENEFAGAGGGSRHGSRGSSGGGAASIGGNDSFVPLAGKDDEPKDPSGNGDPATPPDDTGTQGTTKTARSSNSGNSGGSFADPAQTLVAPQDDPTKGTDPTLQPVRRVPDSGSTLSLVAMGVAGLAMLRRQHR